MYFFRAAAATVLFCCAQAAFAQVADRPTNPFAKDPAAIAAGMAVYNSTCVACHEPAGTGGRGPALNSGNFTHATDDYDIFQVIRGGIAGTQMPDFASLSADNVWRIVSYLKSLPARPTAGPQPAAAGDATAGQSVFFGKGGCTACHEINGRGLDLAADLSAEGVRPADTIRNGILHKSAAGRTALVTLTDGKTMNAVIRAEDSFTLDLEQRDGTLLMLDKKMIRSVSAPAPLSPPDISGRLSSADIDNLVAFLATQMARNLAETAKVNPPPLLPYAGIITPQARDWPTPRGTLDGSGFSALSQITAANAARLQARWSTSLGDGASSSTPIATGGILYVSGAAGAVHALDARSGLPLWQFQRQPLRVNTAPQGGNRGVAVLDGRVFVGTADNKLVALDARNGRVLWETQTAEAVNGYTMTGAPLALRTRIIVGVAGMGPKARGWLDAYDPATGTRLWRLDTAAAQAAGAMTASVGAYEAANVTLTWSTAGGPQGDSVLALDANSGKISWRHALKPGAGGGNIALADMADGGKKRAVLLHVGGDGLLSVLDRADGKPVLEKALTDGPVGSTSFSFDRASAVLYAGLDDMVVATDAHAGRVLWRTGLGSAVGGILATRGGMVFVTTKEGQFIGLDAKSGKIVWHYRTGVPITASPISYAIDGKQTIAVAAGTQVLSFALPN